MPIMKKGHQQKYYPLDQQRREIRMFALAISKRTLMVTGKLIQVDLDKLEEAPFGFYEALSYTWGDPTDMVRCKINGFDHQITRNLEAALISLRGRIRPRFIWIDAICINQEDLDERARQVRLMRLIYSRAVQALIWLGPPDEDAEEAIRVLEYITDLDSPDDYVYQTLLPEEYRSQWNAVIKFFNRPWWRRVWVRQEVACAKESMVICGREQKLRIKWGTLVDACENIFRYIGEFEYLALHLSPRTSGLRDAIGMDTMRETIEQGKNLDLMEALLYSRGTDATDPRDRVYGLIGLVGSQGDDIEVNYLLTPQEIYKNATVVLLKQCKHLNPLSGCQWSNAAPWFPSWVINLEEDYQEMVLRNTERGDELYHAAGGLSTPITFDSAHLELSAQGYILDRIQEVGSIWRTTNPPTESLMLKNWLELLLRAVKRRHIHISEAEILTIFCRTLIADQNFDGERAKSPFYERYAKVSQIDGFASVLGTLIFEEGDPFITRLETVCRLRCTLGTTKGYFGIAGASCLPGDIVCILFGAGVPFILRPDHDKYILIGECYIHGIMDGEAVHEHQEQGTKVTTFCIK